MRSVDHSSLGLLLCSSHLQIGLHHWGGVSARKTQKPAWGPNGEVAHCRSLCRTAREVSKVQFWNEVTCRNEQQQKDSMLGINTTPVMPSNNVVHRWNNGLDVRDFGLPSPLIFLGPNSTGETQPGNLQDLSTPECHALVAAEIQTFPHSHHFLHPHRRVPVTRVPNEKKYCSPVETWLSSICLLLCTLSL